MTPAEQFAEFRAVLAQADTTTVVGRAAVRWVRSECAMTLAYLAKRKELVPENWSVEHYGFLVTLTGIHLEAEELLK